MGLSHLHRRFSAWLALLALLLGTLAPAVTQAVAAGSERAGWVQICSVSGMSWVQIDAGDTAPSDSTAASGCTWCSAHGAAGLPPEPAAWALASVAPALPLDRFTAVVVARQWTPAHSRAPPFLAYSSVV
jgi:hypothetical protein